MLGPAFEELAIYNKLQLEDLYQKYAELSAKYAMQWREYRIARDGLLDPNIWHPLAQNAEQTKNELEATKKAIQKARREKKKLKAVDTQQQAELQALHQLSEPAIDFMRDKKKRIIPAELSRRIIRLAEREGKRKRKLIMKIRKEAKSEIIHCVIARENRPIDLHLADKTLSTSTALPTNFGVSVAFKPIASFYTALLVNSDNVPLDRIKAFDVVSMDSVLVRKDILRQINLPDTAFMYVTPELAKLLKTRLAFVPSKEGYLPPFIEGHERETIGRLNRTLLNL